jgi:ABC-type multidrug transport system ATPase subunit
VAYVPQSDVLIPSLTVQECLRYSALLRLPQDTSPLDLQVWLVAGVHGEGP